METVAPTRRRGRGLGLRLPLLVLLGLLLIPAAATPPFWARATLYPYGLGNGEGFVLDSSMDVAEGRSPYRTLDDYPLTVGNYPPLFYWLNGLAVRILGPTYAAGRAISVASALATALLLAYLAASITGEPVAGALSALIFLTQPTVRTVAVVCRVDMLAGALAFGGLAAAPRLKGRRGLWVPAALFSLALATKHSAVFALAAAFLGIAFYDLRRSLKIAGLTLGLTLAWLAGGLALYGPVMLLNLGPYTATPLKLSTALPYLSYLPKEHLPGLVALPVATVWAVRRGGVERTTAVLYGWVSLASLVMLGKSGSSLLYLTEFTIALALAVGLAAGRILEAADQMELRRGLAAVAAVSAALLVLRAPPPANPAARPLLVARALWAYDFSTQQADDEAMIALIAAAEGPVLAESPDLVLAAGKPLVANPFILSLMARMGRWDEGRLLDDLARRRFAAVQLDSPALEPAEGPLTADERHRIDLTRERFSPAVLKAIGRYYDRSAALPRGTLYLPRQPPP